MSTTASQAVGQVVVGRHGSTPRAEGLGQRQHKQALHVPSIALMPSRLACEKCIRSPIYSLVRIPFPQYIRVDDVNSGAALCAWNGEQARHALMPQSLRRVLELDLQRVSTKTSDKSITTSHVQEYQQCSSTITRKLLP